MYLVHTAGTVPCVSTTLLAEAGTGQWAKEHWQPQLSEGDMEGQVTAQLQSEKHPECAKRMVPPRLPCIKQDVDEVAGSTHQVTRVQYIM
jgi:hypothetical protein